MPRYSTNMGAITSPSLPIIRENNCPSTQLCSHCGNLHDLELDVGLYVCRQCNHIKGRDHNSSLSILNEGLTHLGTVRIEVKPVETESSTLALEYLNRIPYVNARLVDEAGRLTASA